MRLPAAFNGIFGFKPSFGRAPIYPPYRGRVVGPLTRNVTDAALRMAVLSKYKPDARDYTALPYQEIDWIGSLRGDVKGRNSVSCSRLVSASSRRRRCARQSRRRARRSHARAPSSSRLPPSLPAECLTDWIFFGLPDRGAPDPRRVVSDTGYFICRTSLRDCRTKSRICPRSAIASRV